MDNTPMAAEEHAGPPDETPPASPYRLLGGLVEWLTRRPHDPQWLVEVCRRGWQAAGGSGAVLLDVRQAAQHATVTPMAWDGDAAQPNGLLLPGLETTWDTECPDTPVQRALRLRRRVMGNVAGSLWGRTEGARRLARVGIRWAAAFPGQWGDELVATLVVVGTGPRLPGGVALELAQAVAAVAGMALAWRRAREQASTHVASLEQVIRELERTYDATLGAFGRMLDARDRDTEGHSERVARLTVLIAREMGMDEAQIPMLERGALLHDVGKIGVPDGILRKPGPLDDQEWHIMRTHPAMGIAMLEDVSFLKPALDIVGFHHERWDGKGYPNGLKGAAIPLSARIFAVADAFDAMLSTRPYRPARTLPEAIEEIRAEAGKQFDPAVVQAFLRVIERHARSSGPA